MNFEWACLIVYSRPPSECTEKYTITLALFLSDQNIVYFIAPVQGDNVFAVSAWTLFKAFII